MKQAIAIAIVLASCATSSAPPELPPNRSEPAAPNPFEVVPLKHASAEKLVAAIQEQLAAEGMAAHGLGNSQYEFAAIPLEFASAAELAETIHELLEAGRQAAIDRGRGSCVFWLPEAWSARQSKPAPQAVADPATNSLVVLAEPEVLPRVLALIARLDEDVSRE